MGETWLVGGDWNMTGLFFQKYWEFHHPNWRTHIFQRVWNHQPDGYFTRILPAKMVDFARKHAAEKLRKRAGDWRRFHSEKMWYSIYCRYVRKNGDLTDENWGSTSKHSRSTTEQWYLKKWHRWFKQNLWMISPSKIGGVRYVELIRQVRWLILKVDWATCIRVIQRLKIGGGV